MKDGISCRTTSGKDTLAAYRGVKGLRGTHGNGGLSMSLPVTVPSDEHLNKIDTFTHTTRNHLVYDEINSSQIGEKMSQNRIYDVFVTILDNVMEWASQIKLVDVFFCINITD